MTHDLSGQKLGQYELRERLGRGGMADVYKAFQPGMERFVAIKVMLGHLASDQEFVERFRREARAVGQLRHAHIVNVFDFGIERDVYYMVMEFIRGENLKATIEQFPKGMPIDDALRIVSQIADALDYAHKAGMIHRDVKPANIMFIDETRQQAILTDFGIAHILSQPGLTATGAMVGTPAYLSPEVASGRDVDERADIYGLGIILYETLTGRVPYEADTPMAIIMKHVNAPLPSPEAFGRDLPDNVEAIVLKAMMKSPDERYQSAAEMKVAIDQARAELAAAGGVFDRTQRLKSDQSATRPRAVAEEKPTTLVSRPAAPSRARGGLIAAGGIIAALALVIVLLLVNNAGSPTGPSEQDTLTATAQSAEATRIAAAAVTEEPTSTSTDAPTATEPPPTATATDEPTVTATATQTATSTSTATNTPTEAATATSTATSGPTEVASLPETFAPLRDAGLLSGLSPLQDEIDAMLLSGQFDEALQRLDRILEAEPDHVEALAARSLLWSFDGNVEAAQEDAARAVELDPDSPLGYIAQAEAAQQWNVDDPEAALSAAETALKRDPGNPEALWRMSMAHEDLDDFDAHMETLNQAEAAGATGFRFRAFAGEYLYYDGEFERALPYLEAWQAFDTTNTYPMWLRAESLLYLDRPDEAYAAVQQYPGALTEADDLGSAAYVAYRAGDYEQARTWAETARALSDEAYSSTYVLGLLSWYGDGDLDAALNYLDELEDVDFYDYFLNLDFGHDLYLDRGRILAAAGEYDDAIDALNRSLQTTGNMPFVYEAMADVQLEQGNLEAARNNLRQALEYTYDDVADQQRLLERIRTLGAIRPTPMPVIRQSTRGYNLLSGLSPLLDEIDDLFLSGAWDEAEARLDDILAIDPDDAEALAVRAMLIIDQGNDRAALRDAERAVELAPDSLLSQIARSEVALLSVPRDYPEALHAAEQALAISPDHPEALWRASLAHAELGNWDAFVETLNQAEAMGAQGFRFAIYAGEYFHYLAEYERAQPHIEVWYELYPEEPYATAMLAANLVALDRVDEAYDVIQAYPGQFSDAVQLSWPAFVAFRAGDYPAARDWVKRAMLLNDSAPDPHYVQGLISWYVDGDMEAALSHFDVVQQSPDFWNLFLHPDKGYQIDYDRGRVLAAAGQINEAIEAFEIAVDKDGRGYMFEALADAYLRRGDTSAAQENLRAALEMAADFTTQSRIRQRLGDLTK